MQPPAMAARTRLLQPSPTLAMTAKAAAMKAAGEDVISFGAGEPDFDTPSPICDAAIDALRAGKTKYSATCGLKELREATALKLVRENGIHVAADQIVISNGAKQAIFSVLQVLINPGDEVVVFAPLWATYLQQIELAGGVAKVVHCSADNGFIPQPKDIEAAIGPKTKAILFNSPNNPTGAIYPREIVAEIARLAKEHDLWIVADEIYEKLVYEGKHVSIASISDDAAARTLTIGGWSKTYSMTGWRIGFVAGPRDIMAAMTTYQEQVTGNVNTFIQYGALKGLQMPPEDVEAMREEFMARRDLMASLLSQIPGVGVGKPGGAFYHFVRVGEFLGGKVADDIALTEYLLHHAKVAAVPGSVFEGPGHIRLSYANSREAIKEGVRRLAETLSCLRT
ncbi:MAG: pyridoxal phosphate-dependent aminotransferase [Armatimonadetes bacterium]|nr:pyridoxal phosphate-dependent aminotransferase [Armatimonadota bacterium]